MKLKILLLIVGVAIGGGITVIVIQSPSRQLPPPAESQLPTAISNYNKTFKLKTSPPIWAAPTNATH
jgi:hypothetical protein